MTGRGEGYCALVLPAPEEGEMPYGYAGAQGTPVRLVWRHISRWLPWAMHLGRAFGRGWGRHRGRWLSRW